MQNQNEKKTSKFIRVDSFGKIHLRNHRCADTFIRGYFKMFNWYFIVHQDIEDPENLIVSEASSGCCLQDEENYPTIQDALFYAVPLIRAKRYYFATSVGDILVAHKMDLLKENLGVRTLAIDTALWM